MVAARELAARAVAALFVAELMLAVAARLAPQADVSVPGPPVEMM